MTDRKTVSSEELERRLIADAHDPDAWEHVTTVRASRSPRPTWYRQSVRQVDGAPVKKTQAGDAERKLEAVSRKRLHDAIADLPQGQRQAFSSGSMASTTSILPALSA